MMFLPRNLLFKAHSQGLADGFINSGVGLISALVDSIEPETTVLEYGSVSSRFLRLLFIDSVYKRAIGILLSEDVTTIQDDRWSSTKNWPGSFIPESQMQCLSEQVDLAFSNEVFGLIPNLHDHAVQMLEVLKFGGCYYSLFGWHTDNPHLKRHYELRQKRNLPFFAYNLDEVAQTFHQVGFEVGVKRLQVPYFLMFDPTITERRFGNIKTMVSCMEDHCIIFSLRKRGIP